MIVMDKSAQLQKMIDSIKSPAKKQLVLMLQSKKLNEEYEFHFRGSVAEAETFIHRMRVELSRFRSKIREQGMAPKQFKLLKKSISDADENGIRTIVLVRSLTPEEAIGAAIVDEIFSEIGSGKLLQS